MDWRFLTLLLVLVILTSGCLQIKGKITEKERIREELSGLIENETTVNESVATETINENNTCLDDCDDGNFCTIDTCNEETGICEHENKKCPDIAGLCPDGAYIVCSSSCINGMCTTCIPDCTNHTNVQKVPCVESWSCSQWSLCQNGQERRLCSDENKCGTFINKPDDVRPCTTTGTLNITNIHFKTPEWVEITNNGNTLDMVNWTLLDNATNPHVYTFPEFVLESGETVKIHTENGTDTKTDLYWNYGGHIWNDNGDSATLINLEGDIIDSYSY